jgi:hypothetical protein
MDVSSANVNGSKVPRFAKKTGVQLKFSEHLQALH